MANNVKVTYPITKLYRQDKDGKLNKKGGPGEKMLSFIQGENGMHFLKVDATTGKKEELLSASINQSNPVIHEDNEKVAVAHLKDHIYHKEKGMERKYFIYFKSEGEAQGFLEVYKMYQDMDKDLQDNRSDDESASSFHEGLNTQDWPDNWNPNLEERKAAASSGSSGTSNSSSPEPVEFGIGGKTAKQEDDHDNFFIQSWNEINAKFPDL